MSEFQEIRSESFEIKSIPVSVEGDNQSRLPLNRPLMLHRGDLVSMPDRFRVVSWLKIPMPPSDDPADPKFRHIPETIEVGIRVVRAGSKRKRSKTHWRYGKFAEVTNA